jgi:tetratricopeptide (TPR) repeat protein
VLRLQFKESVADLTKSAALSPGEADTINQRGHVFFKWQDFKKALVDFETVTAMAPQEAEGWLMRGQTLNQLGLCPEAVEAYDRALQLQPKVLRFGLGFWSIRPRSSLALPGRVPVVSRDCGNRTSMLGCSEPKP